MRLAQNGCVQASSVVFFACGILFLVSVGAPYWLVTTAEFMALDKDHLNRPDPRLVAQPWQTVNFGLWQACEQTKGCYYWPNLDKLPGRLRATQALMCIGLVCLIAAGASYVWWQLREWQRAPKVLSVTLTLLTGVFGELAAIVFGSLYGKRILLEGWTYWNTVISSSGLLLLAILQICTLFRITIERPKEEEFQQRRQQQPETKTDTAVPGNTNPAYLGTYPPTAVNTPGDGLPTMLGMNLSNAPQSDASLTGFGLALQPTNLDSSFGTATTPVDGNRSYMYSTPSNRQSKEVDNVEKQHPIHVQQHEGHVTQNLQSKQDVVSKEQTQVPYAYLAATARAADTASAAPVSAPQPQRPQYLYRSSGSYQQQQQQQIGMAPVSSTPAQYRTESRPFYYSQSSQLSGTSASKPSYLTTSQPPTVAPKPKSTHVDA